MLIPGLPGLSEHIRVISIVGHYLEHSRIYYFANGGGGLKSGEEYYLASADWMPRNLDRRVELMFPVIQEDIKARVRDILNAYSGDTAQAWLLGSDGSWTRRTPGAETPSDDEPFSGAEVPAAGEEAFSAQEHFLSLAAKASENIWAPRQEFVVRRSDTKGQ
jgi:polyphosphate kinase